VIGGVETFRDASEMVHDLERAKAIQQIALQHDVPSDDRISFTTHYVPHAIVGGDFYAIQKIGDDRYALMLADVMGHGVAAALYTMHLSQLWERYHERLETPAAFTTKVNDELAKVVKTDESFATAVCGLVDLRERTFRFAGAGGPQVLLMHSDGAYECLESSGLPLAVMEGAVYEEVCVEIQAGDRLLLFSDGAVEIHNSEGQMLEIDGLVSILRKQGYPKFDVNMDALEEELLKYSNAIRLEDDLTLMEVRFVE
jgi:serine phosphatase RsbU (regulator of sigma subunit)